MSLSFGQSDKKNVLSFVRNNIVKFITRFAVVPSVCIGHGNDNSGLSVGVIRK